jgi:hypothetical protein
MLSATQDAWRINELGALRTAIANHTVMKIITTRTGNLTSIEAHAFEGFDVLRAVTEKVHMLRLNVNAMPLVPLANLLNGILLRLVRL